jgi:hypothetical protein
MATRVTRRALLILLAIFLSLAVLFSAFLGVKIKLVRDRIAFMKWVRNSHGFLITESTVSATDDPVTPPLLPQWRYRLGDDGVLGIGLPPQAVEADLDRAKALFPEAEEIVTALSRSLRPPNMILVDEPRP